MILDIHMHTVFSDGIESPETMAKQVKKIGLDGFALTDHDTVKGHKLAKNAARKLKLHFIPGIEVTSAEGHVVGLFIKETIKKGLSAAETVEKIHALGGIAIAAHPYDPFRPNVGDLAKTVKFDYIEVFNARVPIPWSNWKARKIADELNLKKVAVSDAHVFNEIGLGTVEMQSINDLRKGKASIAKQKWPGPVFLTVNKCKRFLRKRGLY